VLVEPSHPGNVGAAARAMRAMGLRRLVLVSPRIPGAAAHADAAALASGAHDVLQACREVPDLETGLADATMAVAVSATGREFGPPPEAPERVVAQAIGELRANPSHRVAFVFGTERTGLSIEHALRCQRLLSIPADAEFHSLNLAQAVQIVAWELRRAAMAESGPVAAGERSTHPASEVGAHARLADVEQLFRHLEQALVAVRFLDPAHPKKLMPRLRRLFARTRLEDEEVHLLRGVCAQMVWTARAAGRPVPPDPPPDPSPVEPR